MSELAWHFVRRGRPHYLALLLSDCGREIVTRKYDAFSTDRAYENRPSGLLGSVGALIDRMVLNFPVHAAVRSRLEIVVDALADEVLAASGRVDGTIRVLSAPCGLARDVITVGRRLQVSAPTIVDRVEIVGADLDFSGDVLAEATRRAATLIKRIPIRFLQQDLLRPEDLRALVETDGRFAVANCIGLTAWLTLEEVQTLFTALRGLLDTGGGLVVDNWARHAHSHLGEDLEIFTKYHDDAQFRAALESAGFTVESRRKTPDGIVSVFLARAR